MSDDPVCFRHQRHRQRLALQRFQTRSRFPALEIAVNGEADYIVTGDADLLALHPFRGIPIVTPGDIIETLELG